MFTSFRAWATELCEIQNFSTEIRDPRFLGRLQKPRFEISRSRCPQNRDSRSRFEIFGSNLVSYSMKLKFSTESYQERKSSVTNGSYSWNMYCKIDYRNLGFISVFGPSDRDSRFRDLGPKKPRFEIEIRDLAQLWFRPYWALCMTLLCKFFF